MANSARIDELRKKFDENPRRYFAPLANEYRKSGDLAQAVFILEEYLPQQPGHISGHIVYGQTLFELGRDEEAKRVFETALSLDPENLIALRHLGHISRQAGDFDAARTWYQRLLEADPRDAEIEQLLGSLDAAAQAQAAELSRPSQSAPLPPPAPSMPEVDDSPLMVEHLVQQDAPGAPPRTETHPLPPPLPTEPAESKAEAPAATPEPPPVPVADATAASGPVQEPEEHVEVTEELLDLDDFSFGSLAGASAPPAAEEQSSPASAEQREEEAEEPEPVAASDAAWSEPEHSPEPAVEASSYANDVDDASSTNQAEGFVPFSDLAPPVVDSSAANVDGLETYAFESPQGPVAESEDVGSFYMDTPDLPAAETESVPHAEGFESVEMEFAAETGGDIDGEGQEETVQSRGGLEYADAIEAQDENDAVSSDAVEARQSTPVTSTPVASTPVVATPPTSTPVGSAQAVAEIAPPADAESDAFATETMAKLYLSQGHLESALGIYRTLSARRPDDESLRRQIDEIEERVQRRRREPTPATPMTARKDSDSFEDGGDDDQFAEMTPKAGVPTIRDFLLGIIRRAPAAVPRDESNPPSPSGGTIDALFGSGSELDDDLLAADTLAQAFAPESTSVPLQGRPARQAANELSLDRVFRQPTPAHAGEASGFSFDQFFAGERSDDSHAEAPEKPGDDDIEQFNAWLNGLKKS